MRVYIINANWGGGGPGGIAADLYRVMSAAGNKCRFAYARGQTPSDVCAYRIGTTWDVYLHAAGARIFDNAGFMSDRATQGLIRDIEVFCPDVISIHNPLGYSLNIKRLFQFVRDSGIPSCWTIHDCWSMTGHCITGICERWKLGCGKCPQKKEFPKSVFLDRSAKNYAKKRKCLTGIQNLTLIAPSKWIKGVIEESFLKEYTVVVIHNGIDLQTFYPRESELRREYDLTDKKILLSVAGKWTDNKGGRYLRELADKLDDRYLIVMIGTDSDCYADKEGRMLAIERTENRGQLAQWYTAADVFVNPTMGDNFPTVNLEALACGTPIVTFDTGGSGEAVGECGAVVEAGNVDELWKAIEQLAGKPIGTERCVAQAKNFSKEDRYRDYLVYFEKVAGRSV